MVEVGFAAVIRQARETRRRGQFSPKIQPAAKLREILDGKGEDMVTAFETVKKEKTVKELMREALTKDKYLALKDENMTDSAIVKLVGFQCRTDVLAALKKEWGPVGYGFRKGDTNSTKQPEQPAPIGMFGPELADRIDAMSTPAHTTPEPASDQPPHTDDEEIIWLDKQAQVTGDPMLTLSKRGIQFNHQASREMQSIVDIRIGAVGGLIVMVPFEGKGAYCMGKYKDGENRKIGGVTLTQNLLRAGCKLGRYSITHNEARGHWEAVPV